jgi:hypothetical protein
MHLVQKAMLLMVGWQKGGLSGGWSRDLLSSGGIREAEQHHRPCGGLWDH